MLSTLNVRGIDKDTHDSLRRKAGARDWTLAQLLGALNALHDRVRAVADGSAEPDLQEIRAILTGLDLDTKRR